MSLRNRLLVSILATLLLSLIAGGTFTYWHAVAKIETEMQAAMAVGSRIARNAVDDWEESTDPARRLALLVADFEGDRHLRATLVGPDGKVVLASKVARAERSGAGAGSSDLLAAPAQEGGDGPAGRIRQVRHGRAADRSAQRGGRGLERRLADADAC